MQTLTHWKHEANKNFLGSWSLLTGCDENDKPVYGQIIATIQVVKREMIPDMAGIKKGIDNALKDELLIYFEELDKPMVIHAKTNFKSLETACGTPFLEKWIGKKVCIYVEKNVKAFGQTHDVLRIKPVPKRLCDVCGAVIDEAFYQKSMQKYGKAFCSAECKDKAGI